MIIKLVKYDSGAAHSTFECELLENCPHVSMFMDMEQFLIPRSMILAASSMILAASMNMTYMFQVNMNVMNITCSSSSACSRTPFDFFFLHFFIFMMLEDLPCPSISLPSCWPWSFLELGKGSCMEMGSTADTVTVASSCRISIHHSSRQCPPVLG